MSDNEHDDHEEIARRLREDGQAQAPPDLAGEVMKRVRSEPRRSTSAVRRPLVTLLAASLVTVALVAGLAKLGSGSSSSAGGTSGGGAEALSPGTDKPAQPEVVQSSVVDGVPKTAFRSLKIYDTTLTAGNASGHCAVVDRVAAGEFSLAVPYDEWDSVRAQLDSAKQRPHASPLVTVELHRLARGAAWPPGITCP